MRPVCRSLRHAMRAPCRTRGHAESGRGLPGAIPRRLAPIIAAAVKTLPGPGPRDGRDHRAYNACCTVGAPTTTPADGQAALGPRHSVYLDALCARAAALPFFQLIGLEVVDMQPGRSVLTIRHRPDLAQPVGILHGGVLAALVDTGIAYAILARQEIRPLVETGGSVVAIDLRIKYFRPVAGGALTCVSTVTRMGRRIIHGESVVTNEQGKEVARGDSIYSTVKRNETARHGAPSGAMHVMPEAAPHAVSEEEA